MIAHTHRHVTQVGRIANFHTLGSERETHWVGRIVGYGKRFDFDIADLEGATRGKSLPLRKVRDFAAICSRATPPLAIGWIRKEYPNVQFRREPPQSCDMVGVFMRDQDRGQVFGTFAQRAQTLESFPA